LGAALAVLAPFESGLLIETIETALKFGHAGRD